MRKKNILKYGAAVLATAGIVGGSVAPANALLADNIHNSGAGGMVNCVGGETCVEKVGDEIEVSYTIQMSNIVNQSDNKMSGRGSVIAFPSVIENPKLEVLSVPYNPIEEDYPVFPSEKYTTTDEEGKTIGIDPKDMSEEMKSEYNKDLQEHEEKVRKFFRGYKTENDLNHNSFTKENAGYPVVELDTPHNLELRNIINAEKVEKYKSLSNVDKVIDFDIHKFQDGQRNNIFTGGTHYYTTKDNAVDPVEKETDYVTYHDTDMLIDANKEYIKAINSLTENDIEAINKKIQEIKENESIHDSHKSYSVNQLENIINEIKSGNNKNIKMPRYYGEASDGGSGVVSTGIHDDTMQSEYVNNGYRSGVLPWDSAMPYIEMEQIHGIGGMDIENPYDYFVFNNNPRQGVTTFRLTGTVKTESDLAYLPIRAKQGVWRCANGVNSEKRSINDGGSYESGCQSLMEYPWARQSDMLPAYSLKNDEITRRNVKNNTEHGLTGSTQCAITRTEDPLQLDYINQDISPRSVNGFNSWGEAYEKTFNLQSNPAVTHVVGSHSVAEDGCDQAGIVISICDKEADPQEQPAPKPEDPVIIERNTTITAAPPEPGKDGEKGEKGEKGEPGKDGAPGAPAIPHNVYYPQQGNTIINNNVPNGSIQPLQVVQQPVVLPYTPQVVQGQYAIGQLEGTGPVTSTGGSVNHGIIYNIIKTINDIVA